LNIKRVNFQYSDNADNSAYILNFTTQTHHKNTAKNANKCTHKKESEENMQKIKNPFGIFGKK